MEESKGLRGLNYEEMCVHPNIDFLEGYKPPKFEPYNRTGDPKVDLHMYYDKLSGVEKNEKIRMKILMRSPIEEALTLYIDRM